MLFGASFDMRYEKNFFQKKSRKKEAGKRKLRNFTANFSLSCAFDASGGYDEDSDGRHYAK